jgi:hypothetical protein
MEVLPSGGLKRVQLIQFGYGYKSAFVNYTLSAKNSGITLATPFTESSESGVNSSEFYYDITEQGFINRQTYLQTNIMDAPAWDSTYVGEVISEFIYDNNQSGIDMDLYAKLSFDLGPIAKYPGYYTSNDGFLNDSIYIQDSYYYQDFSYVIRINRQLDQYKELLKSTIHPGGLALFGEFDIFNNFKSNIQLKETGQFTSLLLGEVVNTDDIIANAIDIPLIDEQLVLDSIEKTITIKPVSILDETNIFDSGEIIYSSADDYGPLTYSVEYFEAQSALIAYDD